jgi:hypothetical protein
VIRSKIHRHLAEHLLQGVKNTKQLYDSLNTHWGGLSMYELSGILARSPQYQKVGFDKRLQVSLWGLK